MFGFDLYPRCLYSSLPKLFVYSLWTSGLIPWRSLSPAPFSLLLLQDYDFYFVYKGFSPLLVFLLWVFGYNCGPTIIQDSGSPNQSCWLITEDVNTWDCVEVRGTWDKTTLNRKVYTSFWTKGIEGAFNPSHLRIP